MPLEKTNKTLISSEWPENTYEVKRRFKIIIKTTI